MRTESDYNNTEEPNNPHEKKGDKRRNYALVGGIVGVVVLVVYLITAAYPSRLFSEVKNGDPVQQQPALINIHPVLSPSPMKTKCEELFANSNRVWAKVFSNAGKPYAKASLQLFEDTITADACGFARQATGSFYCPADHKIYIDVASFNAIQKQLGSSANLVQTYIIGHQAGHHIQDLLGITAKLEAAKGRLSLEDYHRLSDKAEIQADYFAGVWEHYMNQKPIFETDVTIAISSATQSSTTLAQIPDRVVADPFDQANLGERAKWFYKGYKSGDLKGADSILTAKDLQ